MADDVTFRSARHTDSGGAGAQPGTAPAGSAHVAWVVAGSSVAGLVAAAALVAAPFIPPTEAGITGAVLLGWALGWALLAGLSVRLTDQPQRWAAAPALVMGLSGVLLVVFGSPVLEALAWVWPPAMLALVVWMVVQARRRLRSRTGRLLVYPALTVLALASVGGGFQTVHGALDAAAHPLPGRLVDVGGHRLHLSCTGSGSPTVVLEPGAGGMSSTMDLITPAVAERTRVCVYDRAGRGWSEPADTPQDAGQVATDLHMLLHRAQVPGPYVLAGHSFGGLYSLTFAAHHPDEVGGLVLIDSTAPAHDAGPTATPSAHGGSGGPGDRIAALVSASARLGLGHLIGIPTPAHLRSTIEEYAVAGSSTRQAAALRDLGDTPLVVLTAGIGHDVEKSAAQDALATLSTNSAHRVVDGVDHPGMVADRRGAAATTRAVLDVVSSVRTALPLTR